MSATSLSTQEQAARMNKSVALYPGSSCPDKEREKSLEDLCVVLIIELLPMQFIVTIICCTRAVLEF